MTDVVWLRDSNDSNDIKTLYANCVECSYYGYIKYLCCLCGSDDNPHVYTPCTLELRESIPKPFVYQLGS